MSKEDKSISFTWVGQELVKKEVFISFNFLHLFLKFFHKVCRLDNNGDILPYSQQPVLNLKQYSFAMKYKLCESRSIIELKFNFVVLLSFYAVIRTSVKTHFKNNIPFLAHVPLLTSTC